MGSVIELENITKVFRVLNRHAGLKGTFTDLFSRDYKNLVAVDHVSMSIEEGEMVGYLGPNGAGKSTTIKIMTGILEPTEGKLLVNGRVPYANRTLNAQNIGVVFGQRSQLWWSLPVIESFRILKEMYCIPDKVYKNNMEMFDELVGVSELYNKPVRQMSLGQRTLCDILAAFLHDPNVVFLDEPTIGLDVSMKSKIRELISVLNREKKTTVVLTTHDMGDHRPRQTDLRQQYSAAQAVLWIVSHAQNPAGRKCIFLGGGFGKIWTTASRIMSGNAERRVRVG